MSDADSEWWSDIDSFPLVYSLVRNCINMKPDKNVESSHLFNGRSIAKIKMNFSKAIDKNKLNPRVSTRDALKKHAFVFMIDFGGDLIKLNEKLNVFSKSMFELI